MISSLPMIPGVSPQLLQALNSRLQQLANDLDQAQSDLASAQATIQQLQKGQAGGVLSVNGQTGDVELTAASVNATPSTGSFLTGAQTAPSGKHLNTITFDSYGRCTAVGWT